MLERREIILRDQLDAASDALLAAQDRYNRAREALDALAAVQGAQAGDQVFYSVRGKEGRGYVFGIEGEYFLVMSGPYEGRQVQRVHARYIHGVQSVAATES